MKKQKNYLIFIADSRFRQTVIFLILILPSLALKAQDSLKYYTSLGLNLDENKKSELAIEAFNKALSFDSLSSDVYYYRAVSLHKTGNYKKALVDFDQAVKLKPDDIAGVLYNRGLTKYLLYDYSGACDDWEKSGNSGFSLAYDAMNKYCRRSKIKKTD